MQSRLTTLDATSESNNQQALRLSHRSLLGASERAQDQARHAKFQTGQQQSPGTKVQRAKGKAAQGRKRRCYPSTKTSVTSNLLREFARQCSTRGLLRTGKRSRAHWPRKNQRAPGSTSSTRTKQMFLHSNGDCSFMQNSRLLFCGKGPPRAQREKHTSRQAESAEVAKSTPGRDQTSGLENRSHDAQQAELILLLQASKHPKASTACTVPIVSACSFFYRTDANKSQLPSDGKQRDFFFQLANKAMFSPAQKVHTAKKAYHKQQANIARTRPCYSAGLPMPSKTTQIKQAAAPGLRQT